MSPEDFSDYYENTKKMEQLLGYYIYIPKSEAKAKNFEQLLNTSGGSSNLLSLFYWFFAVVTVVVIALVIFILRSNRNKERRGY